MSTNSALIQEIRDMRSRVDWLDEERRKMSRKVTELQQGLELKLREVEDKEKRLQELESRLSSATAQISRLSQFDTQLSQFKDEIVSMIEQYDQRRLRGENEIERLRRVEHEGVARELADVRKELPAISRLQTAIELRVAEESRLANLLGEQQNQIAVLRNVVDDRDQALSYLEEKEKQNSRGLSEVKSGLSESSKRWEPIRDQLDLLGTRISRFESSQQDLIEQQTKTRETMKGWLEQIQLGEYERNQRIEKWERELAHREDVFATYAKEWITYSNQYNESKLAVQTLTDWQEQMEKRQREAGELLRLEAQRLHALWDDYQQQQGDAWKNFVIEDEQRRATFNRHERQVQEKLTALDEWLTDLEQQKELLLRIQTAQADAVKRLPLLWIEEVEKAIAQNPHRRRQPALVPVREE